MTRAAIFSDDRSYRYTLEIIWADGPLCQIIGLNPSTADEVKDDPTLVRCQDFARREGCGGLIMTNLFALRETEPVHMMNHRQPIGERLTDWTEGTRERNDVILKTVAARCPLRIAAWGVHGHHCKRDAEVMAFMTGLQCLGKTKAGFPRHPLYLKKTTPLIAL